MTMLAKTTTSVTGLIDSAYYSYFAVGSLVMYVLSVVAMWKMFEKAGQAGWKAIIPIWNTIILMKISGYSPWLILLFLVPIANVIMIILMYSGIAKAYGKGLGTTLGLLFFNTIFILILGFGTSKYVGNAK